MTANQLRYWELRWKQHYENQQIKINWEQLQLEAAKLRETVRHNKKSERQEDQRLIQEQIKLNQTWADLDRKERSMAIDAALRYAGVIQKNIELSQNEKKIANEWYKILSNEKLAVAEQVVKMWETKTKLDLENQKMWMDALGPLASAFGGKAIGLVGGTISNVLNTNEFKDIYRMVQEMYPQYAEYFGPAAPEKFKQDAAKYQSELVENPTLRSDPNYQTYGDWKASEGIKQGDQAFEDSKDYLNKVQGFSGTQGGNNSNSNHSQVISYDQPGVRSTPQTVSGGIKSSGVIYAGKG